MIQGQTCEHTAKTATDAKHHVPQAVSLENGEHFFHASLVIKGKMGSFVGLSLMIYVTLPLSIRKASRADCKFIISTRVLG